MKQNMARVVTGILVVCMVLACAACGGGSRAGLAIGGNPSGTTSNVSGLAATGAAIVGRIYLKDSAGHEHFVDTYDGTYTFALSGLTAPYMLKASWVSGGVTKTLYSFSASSGHANITPLTHMIVVAAAGTEALDTVYAAGDPAAFTALANALPAAVADLQQSLKPLLIHYAALGIHPVSGSFAANHTGMDALLDNITVSYASGNVRVADKTSGATVMQAPAANLAHALTTPEWTAAEAGIANDPDIAVDANGRGLVAWSEKISGHYYIRARFLTGTGAAVTLSTSGDATLPRIAFDSAGNAIVVWAQYVGSRNEIWVSRHAVSSGTWSAAARISSASAVDSAYVPDIAADSAGNTIVTWHQGDGRVNHFDAWAARYAATPGTWTAPAMVSDGVNSAYDVRIAVNTSGQGILAFEQEQGDGTTVSNGPKDIRARTASTTASWGSAFGASTQLNAVAGNINPVYGQIAVAMNAAGGGAVLWVQTSNPLPFVIHAAMYSGSNWQTSSVITHNVLDNNYGPHIAFDASGNATAVWQQQTGSSAYGGTNRYVAGVGWGTSGQFVDDSLGDTYDPRVAVDGAGNATAVWYRWGPSGVDVMLNRYITGSGWGAAQVLSATTTDGSTIYPVPRVAANAGGQTQAIWGVNAY